MNRKYCALSLVSSFVFGSPAFSADNDLEANAKSLERANYYIECSTNVSAAGTISLMDKASDKLNPQQKFILSNTISNSVLFNSLAAFELRKVYGDKEKVNAMVSQSIDKKMGSLIKLIDTGKGPRNKQAEDKILAHATSCIDNMAFHDFKSYMPELFK